MQPPKEAKSLGDLLGDLTRDLTTLVRQEIALAKAEISAKASSLTSGLVAAGIGGAVLFAASLVLLYAVVYSVMALFDRMGWPVWLAPWLVGIVVAIIGYVMLQKGISTVKAQNLTPERTAESVRKDAEVVKEHLT